MVFWPTTKANDQRPNAMDYLLKTEPTVYSFADLQREKVTIWDGVTNPQAVKALLAMRPGDKVFIYHSGGVSAVVGLAKVLTAGAGSASSTPSAFAYSANWFPT